MYSFVSVLCNIGKTIFITTPLLTIMISGIQVDGYGQCISKNVHANILKFQPCNYFRRISSCIYVYFSHSPFEQEQQLDLLSESDHKYTRAPTSDVHCTHSSYDEFLSVYCCLANCTAKQSGVETPII